jgi:hypothetical protein
MNCAAYTPDLFSNLAARNSSGTVVKRVVKKKKKNITLKPFSD